MGNRGNGFGVVRRGRKLGADVSEQFGAMIKRDIARWKKVAAEANIRM